MSDTIINSLHVYAAIADITEAMSKEGIAKGRQNQQQGYKFRGIDDFYAALSPKLAAHKLCILPRVKERSVAERQTKNGSPLFYTTLMVEFDFVSAIDGSRHTVCTVGEAMDSADKSSNKAMSAAYKYAAMQAFCIPTEGDNDADSTTHEVAVDPLLKEVGAYINYIPNAKLSSAEAKRSFNFELLMKDVDGAPTIAACEEMQDRVSKLWFLPNAWLNAIADRITDRRIELEKQQPTDGDKAMDDAFRQTMGSVPPNFDNLKP